MKHGLDDALRGAWPLLLLCMAISASFLAASGPVQWADSGTLLADAASGQCFSGADGPWAHPLYRCLTTGVYALFGFQALSMLNALLLLPLAGALYWLARSLGAMRNLAVLATAVAVLSHAVFWVSTKAEVYLFHSVFVVLAYGLYVERRSGLGQAAKLLLIGLLTGLAASIHALTFVVLLPLYLRLLWEQRGWVLLTLPAAVIGFCAAYPGLITGLDSGLGQLEAHRLYTVEASPYANTEHWADNLLRFDVLWHERKAVALLCLSLLGPSVLGLVIVPKNRQLRLLWWALVVNVVFAASYNIMERFTLFVPGAAFAAVLGVIHLHALLPHNRKGAWALRLCALCSPALLLSMWVLYAAGAVSLPVRTEALPYRDDIHYYMVPYLRDRSAQALAHYYDQASPPGALILADDMPMGALRSAQAAGLLPGRVVQPCDTVNDVSAYIQGPGAFLPRTSFCEGVKARFSLEPVSVGYQLVAPYR